MKRSAGFFALVLLLSFSGLAQQSDTGKPASPQSGQAQTPAKPGEDDVVKITTNLVQVDAVITDSKGKIVKDLRQDEVQILEDGKQQKITHFSLVLADVSPPPSPGATADKTAPPLPPTQLRPEEVRRTIAILVDDLGLSFQSTHYVRKALKQFVDEQMQAGDLVAIVRTAGGMGALQQFTSNKRQLHAAIDRVKWFASGRSGIGAFAPLEDTSRLSERTLETNEEVNQFREDSFAVGTLGAVSYVVKGMRELPGRKSILLVSDGFKIFSRGNSVATYRMLQALRRLVDQANRATVVIYTMSAKGLQYLGLTAGDNMGAMTSAQVEAQLTDRKLDAFESQEGLDYLAMQTGGIPIRNTNDLSNGIRRVIEDQGNYYVIGYRPEESTFNPNTGRREFHKLSLKVTRPGKYNVRMRTGFYGVSDENNQPVANTPRERIFNALMSPFGTAGVRIKLTTLFANDVTTGSYLRSLLHINGNDLTFTQLPDGWRKAQVDVVAVIYGDNGAIVDQVGQTYTMRMGADEYKQMLKYGVIYRLTVPVKKPGAYQLRAALRDYGSDRVGSASQFVEVPDVKKNRLTISSVVISAADQSVVKKPIGPAQATDGEKQDAEAQVDTTTSAATRQFVRGNVLQYAFVVYNARTDKTTGQPQAQTQVRLFRDGKPVFSGKELSLNSTNQLDLKRVAVSGALRIGADMEPGEYVLQVVVTDPLAEEKYRIVTQWIDFEIMK